MSNTQLNILKINSSSRGEDSVSRQLVDRIVARFSAANDVTLVSRDLASGLPVVSEAWINSNYTPKSDRSDDQRKLLQQSDELIAELRAADVVVIGLPIYNFGVPAALKLWMDLICRTGETFNYGEAGPVGLLENKRMIVAVASGGVPVGSPVDFATPLVTQVFNFIGITDVTYVAATGLAAEPEAAMETVGAEIAALNV